MGGYSRRDGTVPRSHRGTDLLRESTERRRHKERDRRSILLNAHTDTVDPGDPTAWSGDPLSGNLLYGRGSCDMKGGLVTHLVALDALSDLGLGLRGDVTVAATVGEENGGLGALSTVLRGYSADAAIITEPTRLALVPAQGGSLVFRLKIGAA